MPFLQTSKLILHVSVGTDVSNSNNGIKEVSRKETYLPFFLRLPDNSSQIPDN